MLLHNADILMVTFWENAVYYGSVQHKQCITSEQCGKTLDLHYWYIYVNYEEITIWLTHSKYVKSFFQN